MLDRIRREPALVTGAVSALIALGVAFGLNLSGEQTGAIMAVVTAILAIVTRQQVTPNVTVAAAQPMPDAQIEAGPAATEATGIPKGAPVDVIPADPRFTGSAHLRD